VNIDSLLQTHAEVAVALAGFASVAAVLRRPLSRLERGHFLSLLFTALIQVLGSLAPVWLSSMGIGGALLWRIASALVLTLSIILVFVIAVPQRSLSPESFVLINTPVTRACNALAVFVFGALLVDTVGFPVEPNFGLYYAALLLSMTIIFVMFASVVVSEDNESI